MPCEPLDATMMPAMPKTLHLIPDTNVFMQCRDLNELPWSTAFPEWDAITLVLVAPVIREIDRQKGGHCSGSMIRDTNVGGNIATISEVSDVQKATIFFS